MQKIADTLKIEAANLSWTQSLSFFSLLFISIFLPSLIHQQAITGPLINAILLIATVKLGAANAITIGLIPSVVALSRGLLPLALAPIVPFIMLANALYVTVFAKLNEKSFVGAVLLAAAGKFALLYFVSQLLLANLLPQQFLAPASQMMSWPQLVTALAGGLIAYLLLKAASTKSLSK